MCSFSDPGIPSMEIYLTKIPVNVQKVAARETSHQKIHCVCVYLLKETLDYQRNQ